MRLAPKWVCLLRDLFQAGNALISWLLGWPFTGIHAPCLRAPWEQFWQQQALLVLCCDLRLHYRDFPQAAEFVRGIRERRPTFPLLFSNEGLLIPQPVYDIHDVQHLSGFPLCRTLQQAMQAAARGDWPWSRHAQRFVIHKNEAPETILPAYQRHTVVGEALRIHNQ